MHDAIFPLPLSSFPVHLGLGGRVRVLPEFDGSGAWYGAYEAATEADGGDGRLLSWHRFDESWTAWEMHPSGHEVVVCVAGSFTLVQAVDGGDRHLLLQAGEWVVNAPGVWHTADLEPNTSATAMFITSGRGTQGRAR
jgi:hypothetical protein